MGEQADGDRPAIVPSRLRHDLPERLRTWPGAHRSRHPLGSFAAVGANAATLMADQPWDGIGQSGTIGGAPSHLLPARDLLAYAVRWIEERFGA
jgi:aminoglycoside N3'-acetyltransferase